MKEVQRYFKIISESRYSAYLHRRAIKHGDQFCLDLRLRYDPASVVWAHPKTVGIFVFTDIETAFAYHNRFRPNESTVVEVFPLGWQVKPPHVLWADRLARYLSLWKRLKGKKDIWSVMTVFEESNWNCPYDHFQTLWENTICCEGVLVGQEMRDNPFLW